MTDRETRTALPSTPAAAPRGWVTPAPRRSRLELVIWATAVLFGSTIGGTLALRAEPAASAGSPATATATSPSGSSPSTTGASTATSPSGGSPSTTGGSTATSPSGGPPATIASTGSPAGATGATIATARAAAIGQIRDTLGRFVRWSHRHAGARCPDAAALGARPDPWGHALLITCTDQPADQIAGVVSAGPDGVAGTRDDIESWTLGDAVTDPVRGARWRSSRTAGRRSDAGAAAPPQTPQPTRTPAGPGAGSSDNDGDGIPDRR